jgi:hypothetical protein
LLESFVFLDFEAGTEEEVFEGVPAEDSVDHEAEFMALEIDPVVADAEAV